MLGKFSFLNNSIFLSVRCAAALCCLLCETSLKAQTALRSPHFILYNNSSTLRLAEQALHRLEQLRSAIQALHGENWAAASPLRIWLPESESQWRNLTISKSEQGQFISGTRHHWIVANPDATFFLEVLSHEYIHAVLYRTLPNLPTWFEEGICEYYSTLELRGIGNRTTAVLGRPPNQRLKELAGLKSIDIIELSDGPLQENDYARAWASAYHLWPNYKPGSSFPGAIVIGRFPLREFPIDFKPTQTTLNALSPIEMAELEIEFRTAISSGPPLTTAGEAANNAQQIFLEGLRLADESNPTAAIPLLEKACQLRPSNSTWWQALALAYKDANQLPQARTAIARAIDTAISPSESTAALTLQKSLN